MANIQEVAKQKYNEEMQGWQEYCEQNMEKRSGDSVFLQEQSEESSRYSTSVRKKALYQKCVKQEKKNTQKMTKGKRRKEIHKQVCWEDRKYDTSVRNRV